MDFIEYINAWVKDEVLQGRVMIGFGIIFLIVFVAILKSENEFFRGTLLPLGILVFLLVGYGGYILYSRPAHAKKSIELYQESKTDAVANEREKHINDNRFGKTLMRIYPLLMLISIASLFFGLAPHYKGMAIGFTLLFLSIFIIDNGFVSRSDQFLDFLKTFP